ncbi:MAG: sigma-70 family RNA polymerase sigma factor [Myxococcota bacterium]
MLRNETDWFLAQVKRYPKLDREEEVALARKYRAGDKRAGDRLLRSSLRFVVPIARRYVRSGEPFEDLIAEGNLGLVHALKKYDPERGTRFGTYSSFWVRTYLTRYVRRTRSVVSSSVHDQALLYAKVRKERSRLAVTETDDAIIREKIAGQFEISVEEVSELEYRFGSRDASLDVPVDDDMGIMMRDTLVETAPDPSQLAATSEVIQLLRRAVEASDLDERERVVVEERIMSPPGEEPSLAELGRRLEITREWARQLERRAMKKLDQQLEDVRETLRADLRAP